MSENHEVSEPLDDVVLNVESVDDVTVPSDETAETAQVAEDDVEASDVEMGQEGVSLQVAEAIVATDEENTDSEGFEIAAVESPDFELPASDDDSSINKDVTELEGGVKLPEDTEPFENEAQEEPKGDQAIEEDSVSASIAPAENEEKPTDVKQETDASEQSAHTSTEKAPAKQVTLTFNKGLLVKLLCVVLAIAAVFGIYSMNRAAKEKEAFNEYVSNMELARSSMILGGATAEDLCNTTRQVWRAAIFEDSRYDWDYSIRDYYSTDFNTSLALLFADSSIQSKVSSIQSNQELVDSLMKDLANPPEGCETAYATLNALYQDYRAFTNLAISPTGSLTTYSEKVSQLDSSFMSNYELLDTQIPEQKE